MVKPSAKIAVIIAKIILTFMVYWFLIDVVKVWMIFDKSKDKKETPPSEEDESVSSDV